jgi:hypothetical protein
MGGSTKCEPAFDVSDLAPCRVLLPPTRIRPGWDQTDHGRASQGALVGFTHPGADGRAIGRVHPAHALPGLPEPVVGDGKVSWTFGVLRRGADVEREAKSPVEGVIKVMWGRPFDRALVQFDGNR